MAINSAHAFESSSSGQCENSTEKVAECFSVRGKLSFYNGTPSARIKVDGKQHILGIRDNNEKYEGAMAELDKKLSFDNDARGVFFVCPLTSYKTGEMQMVCIEKATNIEFRNSP